MQRFRTPEIVLGIGIGILLSLFVAGIGSYQTALCEQSNQNQAAGPNSNDPHATGQQGGGGDHKKPEHGKHPPFFACGASGLLKSAVGFMDSHEGFFVGGFTLSLFFATILLWRSTDKLWKAGETQRESSERIAERQRRSSERIATWQRMSDQSANQAARAGVQAAIAANKLSSENFSKLNRPYVFVYGVKNIEPGQNENFDALVPYFVANHGQTPAMIERMQYCLSVGNEPAATGTALDDHPLVVSPVLGSGEKITAEAQSVTWVDSGTRVIDVETKNRYVIPEVKVPGTTWYFWVKVFYRGPFSDGHETSACWRYDRETCQFVQFGGTEYNYTK